MPRVGVISDTHGLLRPEGVAALHGVVLIIHAGDIGSPAVLTTLQTIAPVTAVRGNNDHGPWAKALPETSVVETGGLALYVLHDANGLDLDPSVSGFAAVISGHSHKPSLRGHKWRPLLQPRQRRTASLQASDYGRNPDDRRSENHGSDHLAGESMTAERGPASRSETVRASILSELRAGPLTALELSGRVGLREKEIFAHLEHIARSLRGRGQRLEVEPSRCLDCDFVFRKRDRLSAPGRCPKCQSERITAPRFSSAR
jgi:putative phosphoesterase